LLFSQEDKIDSVRGVGSLAGRQVRVAKEGGSSEEIEGRRSSSPPVPIRHRCAASPSTRAIVTSTGALALARCRPGCSWVAPGVIA